MSDVWNADRRQVLALSGAAGAAAMLAPLGSAVAAAPALRAGRDQAFDANWRFRRGAGADVGVGQETASFADAAWRVVDLPHDWSIEDLPDAEFPGAIGPFERHSKAGTATGFTQGGEGWYRKHFHGGGLAADARVELLFDGINGHSDIWLNGHSVGENYHGYRPFAVDLTPFLHRGGDNVLALRVRNLGQNSRWYSGSGLYRQVRLDVLPAGARLARWGVAASTRRIDAGGAVVAVASEVLDGGPGLHVLTRLRDTGGAVVAEARTAAASKGGAQLQVATPKLWSPDNPNLYTLEVELRRGEQVLDRISQHFGIRIVTMDAERGLAINGEHMNLRGGCIHHDNGLLGACAYPDADARRIGLLKARGYNAIRSSHNPASRSLREACDRLGMLMIDEAFDMWQWPKLPDDFSNQFPDHWQEVVEALVLSARNSPSVIMWSIGNEIPNRSTPAGVEWEWKLANMVRRLDPTRPVTAALNGVLGPVMVAADGTARAGFAGKADNASTIFLDVPGYNYRMPAIEPEHPTHPERVVYASETFPRDCFDYAALMARAPYFMGEFVWTAMDYLGEAGVGSTSLVKPPAAAISMVGWPWVVSWCGDIDLIGGRKAPSFARDVAWGVSKLEVAVQRPAPGGKVEAVAPWGWHDELQSWSWTEAGRAMLVRVYSVGDRVVLTLNGAKVAEVAIGAADRMQAELRVPYAPGVLEAVAYRGGAEIARRRLESVGPAAGLRVVAEPASGMRGREALAYVGIAVVDAGGRVLPDDARAITLTVNGPAQLAGFGSGNPLAVGSFQSATAQSFRGQALAILRLQARGGRGRVWIEARSDGLQGAAAVTQV